jgi:elongation factor 1-beta
MEYGDIDLSSTAGLKKVEEVLRNNKYLKGDQSSPADSILFNSMKAAPGTNTPHLLDWYNDMRSSGDLGKQSTASGTAPTAGEGPKARAADEGEEANAESEKIEQRAKEYDEERGKCIVSKSNVILDIKPWNEKTDMRKLEEQVRGITKDGLLWGASKIEPVGYGINKLEIICVVEDDKVSVDELTEEIQNFKDYVQSVDILSFNKV